MAVRPIYTPRFVEDATTIKTRMLGNIPDDWRKEEGDFITDSVGADPAEIIQLEMNQDRVLQNAFPQFCEDDLMDFHMQLRGVPRMQATASKRALSITAAAGVRIPKGYTFTSLVLDGDGNPIEFTADAETIFAVDSLTQTVNITCNLVGIIGNLATGSAFVLQPPIPGIATITDTGVTVLAIEKEDLDTAWTRLLFKAANPDTGGNKNDYRRWVIDEFPKNYGMAVGKCVVVPRWNGRGTVKVILVGTDYKPASTTLVNAVQEYLDPLTHQGYGEGKAPAPMVVTVEAADETVVNVAATLSYASDAVPADVLAAFMAALTEYLHSLVFEINPSTLELYPVSYNKVASLLISTKGVADYSGLTINGGTSDVDLQPYYVPTVGTVTLT